MRINISISPDTRYRNSGFMNLIGQVSWSPQLGVYLKKKVGPLRMKIPSDAWDFKKSMIKGNTPELAVIRDRIFSIKDFARQLDLHTAEENIQALKKFMGLEGESKEVKLVTLTDYVNEFVRLKQKRYSRHTIRKYTLLVKLIVLYRKHTGLLDSFFGMSEDKQMVWFSGFTDFLLFNEVKEKDGYGKEVLVKRPYENGSAKEVFKLIKSVVNSFKDTGITVNLAEFADYLKEGNTQGTYCSVEEVREIYKQRNELQDLYLMEQKAADLFLFQVFTGFRYDELKHVTQNSVSIKIKDGRNYKVINNIADKEGLENSVPMTFVVEEIFKRWEGKTKESQLLPMISEYQYNSNLHTFLERIQIMHRVEKRVRYRGNDRVETEEPRYKAITSHAGRHSYSHLLSSGGIDIGGVSHLMNHASPETTNKNYKHLQVEQLQVRALDILNKAV